MSADQIRAAVRAHAATLPRSERGAFAEIFAHPSPLDNTAPAEDTQQSTWPVEDDPLLTDIDDLVDRISSGDYYEGFGWDPEIRDQRSFGDESWVWEMDGLLDDAQAAFLAGDLGLARAAYERLVRAFDLDQEVGTFCGPSPPDEMVRTDVAEAESQYLRAVYETTPPAQRAATLVDEWFDLPSRHAPTLAAVRESRPHDLPGLNAFLPDWIAELTSLAAEQPGATARVRPLLTEATELHGGADGLANLAHTPGPGRGERFLDWVQALLRAGREKDAAAAAREALAGPSPYGEAYARLAEHLAELTRDDDDDAARLTARRTAWRAKPTDQRLLALHSAIPADAVDAVLAGEIDELAARPDTAPRVSGRLHALLLLLAGRTGDAAALLRTADHWPDHADRVVLPYLLAAGSGGPAQPGWATAQVAGLLAGVDEPWRPDWWAGPTVRARVASEAPTLSSLLITRITDPTAAESERWLTLARAEVDRRVRAIISGKQRGRYAEAARLAAAVAEALALAGHPDAGAEFLATLRTDFPRHTAFRRELDTATKDRPTRKTGPR